MRKLLTVLLLAALPAVAYPFILKDPVAVTVSASATSLASGVGYTFVEVCNTDGSKVLYLGFTSSVTAVTGRPVQPGACVQFAHLAQSQTFFGITSSGSLVAVVTKAFET